MITLKFFYNEDTNRCQFILGNELLNEAYGVNVICIKKDLISLFEKQIRKYLPNSEFSEVFFQFGIYSSIKKIEKPKRLARVLSISRLIYQVSTKT